jgi:class 3 adenylate cyclase/tetratricopeptide (TPR) repeat protein
VAETRRLAAIMFTDMVGSSDLAHRDEALALRLGKEHEEVVRPLLVGHDGREVKALGDGFLVEFPSALQALECAVEIQRTFLDRNERPGSDRIELRIGIHLGDVVHRDGDVFGDAVNIASRIEPLAETSGVCISGPVFDQVRNKIPYPCTQLEHAFLKNIETPISVYSVDLPWVVPSAARVTPWTDRESELGTVQRLIEDASEGKGRLVGFSGESGIGKTRLANEAVRRATGKGFRTLRGRGHQDEQPVPYSLWVQVVREFLREVPAPLLYKVSTNCGAALTKLAPEVGARLGPVLPPEEDNSEAARLRFFEAVAQFFINLSQEAPLAILLDDLQWADPGSLRLLNYLADPVRARPILVLLTYRDPADDDTPLLRSVVEDLTHTKALVEVPLRRMDGRPARQLVGAILGVREPPSDLVSLIAQKTGGNPLFVEELLRSMTEERQLVRRGESWDSPEIANIRVPSTMRDVILKRVERAGDHSRTLLSVGAVLGQEFDFELLQQVSGVDPEPLLSQVEALLRARLLREREISPGHSVYLFADDQTREVLYQELSLVRRQRYHLKVAQALEARSSDRAVDNAGELALHYQRGGEPSQALHWTVLAARNSAKLYAREQAVAYCRIALEILKDAPDERVRAEVLELLGDELATLGQYEESTRCRTEAAGLYEGLGDRRRAGTVLRLAASHARWMRYGEFEVDEAQLNRARLLLESVDPSAELVRLYLDLASYLQAGGRFREVEPVLTRAHEVAGAIGDPALQASVDVELVFVLPVESRAEAQRGVDRLLEFGRKDRTDIALSAYILQIYLILGGYGELARGEEWVQRAQEYAREINAPDFAEGVVGGFGSFTTMLIGDLDESLRRAERHAKYIQEHGQPQTAHNLLHFAYPSIVWGKFGDAEKYLDASKAILGSEKAAFQDGFYLLFRSLLELSQGHAVIAEDLALKALQIDRTRGFRAFDVYRTIWYLSTLTDCAAGQHALDRMDAYVEELRGLVELLGDPTARAFLTRARGQRAFEGADYDRAAGLLRESCALFRKTEWKLQHARTCLALSQAEMKLGSPTASAAALDEAIRLLSAMRAQPDLDRALALRSEWQSGSVRA